MGITFYTVDVGHGLCQVIRFSNRRAIVIDGGGKLGKRIVEEFLKRYVDVVVAYVATHNDADHVGAAPEILDNYPTAGVLEHIWLLFDRPATGTAQIAHDVIPLLGYADRRKENGTIRDRHALYVDDPGIEPLRMKIIHSEPDEKAELQLLYPRIMDVSNSFARGRPDASSPLKNRAF